MLKIVSKKVTPLLYFYELTDEEREVIYESGDIGDPYWNNYFRYEGDVYHIRQFTFLQEGNDFGPKWEGVLPTSAWDGLVIRMNSERIMIGHFVNFSSEISE